MELAFACAVILYFISLASAQYIQIRALPQTVSYGENDLVIVCSITNPSQFQSVFFIQLQMNSSTEFNTVVSVTPGQPSSIQWNDNALEIRATAIGNLDSPSSAQLRLTIDKASVQCPNDFKMYKCKMSGLTTAADVVTKETIPITVSYTAKPNIIEMPRVRILNENFDTPDRQFSVATAIQLTCRGEVGSDASQTIRWCAQKTGEFTFTGLAQTPIYSEATQSGCLYTRSSTITYNLTNQDTFTQFMCESGDTGLCGTGTAIQYVNITLTSAQNIRIQALPETVILRENNLTIVCSITNPSQLNSVFFIQLLKNSSTIFKTIVSVATGQLPPVQWKDSTLQSRSSATGNINSPNTAQLKLTIDKANVQCPIDFEMYMCKMSGFSSTDSVAVTQETSAITISYIVKPTVIEMPRVRIQNEVFDTPNRHFAVGTAIQLTCRGEVGSDPINTIRWCSQRAEELNFIGLAHTPIHSMVSLSGCQYTRSSTITYILTSQDTFTKFLCESGYSGLCGTGTAIQYVNISITEESSTINIPTTDERSKTNETNTTKTSAAGAIAGGMTILTVGILLILHVV